MAVQVRKLAENVHRQSWVRDERIARRGRHRRWSVGEVCYERTSKDPIVGRILEDVACRHCSQAEAVDEDRLKLSLEKVEYKHPHGQRLQSRRRCICAFAIDIWSQKVDSRVYQQRPKVLDDEDSPPGDLRTEILDLYHIAVS